MGIEIERKFLVTGDDWRSVEGVRIAQGYLAREISHSVRVRIAGEQAWLTIKARVQEGVNQEFEYPLPLADAQALLKLCPQPVIEKTRRTIAHQGFVWEVDEFFGLNAGLVVAEIELETPAQTFPLPDWIGEEVTDDPRYLNANLTVHPFTRW